MKMSMSRSTLAAIFVVGITVSAPGSVHTAYAANGTTSNENLEVASSLNNQAELYHRQGRYAEAVPLLERALAIWVETLGAEHPKVAMSRKNLGHLYHYKAQYAEAEQIYRRALTITAKALGREDSAVAMSRAILVAQESGHDTESIQGGITARIIRTQQAKWTF